MTEAKPALSRTGPGRTGARELRVAAILDEPSAACLRPECELLEVAPDSWRELLAEREPQLLLVESAWAGSQGTWQYQVASYDHPDSAGVPRLRELVEWCRGHEVPTVFWSHAHPVHLERFRAASGLFDRVFTSYAETATELDSSAERPRPPTRPLAHGVQPLIHNPTAPPAERSEAPCYLGAYHGDRPAAELARLEMLLDAARPRGLVVHDPTLGVEERRCSFPERFQPHLAGRLRYERTGSAYKAHRLALSGEPARSSPTMISRRVLEAAACETPVVSTASVALNSTFGELAAIVEDGPEAERALEWLVGDEDARRRRAAAARRLVLSEHTMRHRLRTIALAAGCPVVGADVEVAVVLLLDRLEEVAGLGFLADAIAQQSRPAAEVLIGLSRPLDLAGELSLLGRSPGPPVRVVAQEHDTPRGERYAELAAMSSSPWVAVMHPAHRYGRHHLRDLGDCTRFARADAVGTPVALNRDGVEGRPDPAGEHWFVPVIHPQSALARRELVADRGWPDELPSAWSRLRAALAHGVRYYGVGRGSFTPGAGPSRSRVRAPARSLAVEA